MLASRWISLSSPFHNFPISASCPFSLRPDFTPLPLEDPPEEGKVGQIQFGPYKGADEFDAFSLFKISPDFLEKPLSTFLPVEWGGRVFAYCAEKGFCFSFSEMSCSLK